MRFAPESEHGANAGRPRNYHLGLCIARDVLEKIKKDYPDISYADLWSLGNNAFNSQVV